MRARTRCILSIVLSLLPALRWAALQAGDLLSATHPRAAWILSDFVGMGILGESTILLYFLYPILCAAAACAMYHFSQEDLPARLEKLLLGFPVAGGVVTVLNFVLSVWAIGFEVFEPLTALSALALLGWLVCSITALRFLRRENNEESMQQDDSR